MMDRTRWLRARNEISVSGNAQDFDLSPRRCCSSIAVTMVQNSNAGIRSKDKQDVAIISFRALRVMVGTIFCVTAICFSQAPAPGSMYYLRLKIKDNVVSVVSATVVKGTAKSRWINQNDGDITVSVTSKAGARLLAGTICDPRIVHADYPDPGKPGKLNGGTRLLSEAEFTVRIPYRKEFNRVSFFKRQRGALARTAGASDQPGLPLGVIILQEGAN